MLAFLTRSTSKLNKSEVQLAAPPDASKPVEDAPPAGPAVTVEPPPADALAEPHSSQSAEARPSASIYSSDGVQDVPTDAAPASTTEASPATSPVTEVSHTPQTTPSPHQVATEPTNNRNRRFTLRPLSFRFMNGQTRDEHKPMLSAEEEHKKKLQVEEDRTKRAVKVSSADKRAKESAVVVRALIVGPSGITLANTKAKPVSRAKVEKAKSQLLKPKSAKRVIAQLRALPTETESVDPVPVLGASSGSAAPIRAVCLPYSDEEAVQRHFCKLTAVQESPKPANGATDRSINLEVVTTSVASVYNTSIEQLKTLFEDMELVDLLTAPNLGFGQPADEAGILAGSVPTARAVLEGIQRVTPQLLSLGYATGKVLVPDHSGIHPPTDRMSLITYWWGFEVTMPPPTIAYLSRVPSIAHSVINVVTALAVLNGGVAEVLPFVRYISSFIDHEFNMIRSEDKGKGVVCAATWLIPAALVPRSWDFTEEPVLSIQPAPAQDPAKRPKSPETTEPKEQPSSPPVSPPLAPSRPASPPTLLPPLSIHDPAFGDDRIVNSTDAPNSEVARVSGTEERKEGDTETLPDVTVVPATPTSQLSTKSDETVQAASA